MARQHRHVAAVVAGCAMPFLAGFPAHAADVFAGQEIYETHCVRCHGRDGRPTLPNVPNFYQGERLSASDSALVAKVKQGRNLMPSFDRLLKDRDILNALSYIRTLQR